MSDPLTWTGDLNDDCCAEWGGMFAHAEEMADKVWWCAVYRADVTLLDFSTTLAGNVRLSSGEGARWVCEMFMRAEFGKVE